MSDKNNEFINLYEFLDNTPVSQLTHTELSNLIDGISNTWVTMMHDGKHDFDEENVRQGFNHLFRYKAASYPDECCSNIIDMVIEESRNVPDDEYWNQTRRVEVIQLNKELGFENS